jgi:hypothetical protein
MPDFVPHSTMIIAGAGFTVGLPIGLAVALVLTLLYVGSTAKKKGERRLELALTSAFVGPMVGALIASVEVARGRVIPVFVGETYGQYAGMGLIVGVLVGLAFLMTAALTSGKVGKPPVDPEL